MVKIKKNRRNTKKKLILYHLITFSRTPFNAYSGYFISFEITDMHFENKRNLN